MEDVVVGDKTFKRGDRLALFLAHANMDTKQFSCPHQLNSDRNAVTHLSLGKGLHACLGAPIIREALTIIPATMLNYFPRFTIETDKVVWGGSGTIRGVVELPGNHIATQK
jgi:cytochrome P450